MTDLDVIDKHENIEVIEEVMTAAVVALGRCCRCRCYRRRLRLDVLCVEFNGNR